MKKPYKSKLKNPDRHIDKLKDEIERLRDGPPLIKIIWSWLMWQFYQGRAKRLLATSTEIVKRMDSRQKLAYVMNAACDRAEKK